MINLIYHLKIRLNGKQDRFFEMSLLLSFISVGLSSLYYGNSFQNGLKNSWTKENRKL